MNDTIKQNKWWIYLIFFSIGIVSFIISVVLGNIFFLPLLICSILFAIALYKFKKQSFDFALMAFVISFATSSLIFYTGFFGGGYLEGSFMYPLLILLILSAIAWIVFKERPLVNFSLKAFVVSFGTIFIIFAVLMPNSPLSLLLFFGPQEDATTSTSINIESSAENITIYVPVLLDENKNVLKMYENPEITGNVTTAVIDTEYGKALMISGSGSGDYLFNWNEVPGKDTNRFVGWLEGIGHVWPGEKLDINKTDDGKAITISGGTTRIYQLNETGVLKFYHVGDIGRSGSSEVYLFNWNEVPGKDTDRFVEWLESEEHVQPGEKLDISKTDDGRVITVSGRSTMTYWLNGNGELEYHGVTKNVMSEMFGQGLFFIKEENGQLNLYAGNNEINMNEKHGIFKEDTQISAEFLKGFTISMSNYTSPEPFFQQRDREFRKISVWVYSDCEVEKVRFRFNLDPGNRIDRRYLSIGTGTGVHLRKGWQLVNLSVGIGFWD
ncbi:MAG TPA: hypothetical protein VMW53_10865 [archaeon]|nr:hypothetical protein [archaeon]